MNENELVVVFNAGDEVEALLYRTLLEEAGINVLERPLETAWLETIKQDDLHSQLLVYPADVERARLLIEAFQQEAVQGTLAVDNPENLPDDAGSTA